MAVPTPINLCNSWKADEANCGPRSEIILFGIPNCLNTLHWRRSAVSIAVMFVVQGDKMIALETS